MKIHHAALRRCGGCGGAGHCPTAEWKWGTCGGWEGTLGEAHPLPERLAPLPRWAWWVCCVFIVGLLVCSVAAFLSTGAGEEWV